jgi:hypothetical protein
MVFWAVTLWSGTTVLDVSEQHTACILGVRSESFIDRDVDFVGYLTQRYEPRQQTVLGCCLARLA